MSLRVSATATRRAEEALAYLSALPGGNPDWVDDTHYGGTHSRADIALFAIVHPDCEDAGHTFVAPATLGEALAHAGLLAALSATLNDHSFDLLAGTFGPLARREHVVLYILNSYGENGPECHPGPCDEPDRSKGMMDGWGLYCEAHNWGSQYFKSRAAGLKALEKPFATWCPKCAAVATYLAMPPKQRKKALERRLDSWSFDAVRAEHLQDLLSGMEEPPKEKKAMPYREPTVRVPVDDPSVPVRTKTRVLVRGEGKDTTFIVVRDRFEGTGTRTTLLGKAHWEGNAWHWGGEFGGSPEPLAVDEDEIIALLDEAAGSTR